MSRLRKGLFLRSLSKAATPLPYHTLMHHSVHFFHVNTTRNDIFVCFLAYFLIIYLEYKFFEGLSCLSYCGHTEQLDYRVQ